MSDLEYLHEALASELRRREDEWTDDIYSADFLTNIILRFFEERGESEYEEGVRTIGPGKFREIHRHVLILREPWIDGSHRECGQ